jgi:hypothetical protein
VQAPLTHKVEDFRSDDHTPLTLVADDENEIQIGSNWAS